MLSPEQAIAFLGAVGGDRLEALYTVGVSLGLRQGEQIALRWRDIDLENGRVHVRWTLQRLAGEKPPGARRAPSEIHLVRCKRRSQRTIDLPEITIAALSEHRRRQEEDRQLCGSRWVESTAVHCQRKTIHVDDFVFTTTIGTPLEGCNLNRRFQSLLEQCGIPKHRFHDLRHTAATLLLVQGVSNATIMKVFGWSQIAMLERYTHLVDAMRSEAASKMDEILSRPSGSQSEPGLASRLASRKGLVLVKSGAK